MPVGGKTGRYDARHLPEAQFEPGSRGRVLRNLLGIKRKREMDEIEAREFNSGDIILISLSRAAGGGNYPSGDSDRL